MQNSIKDFDETEQWTVQEVLKERWPNNKIEFQLADVDIRIHKGDRELTETPAIFWEYKNSNFIIFKTADHTYQAQFYYLGRDQYGTNVPDFDNIHDCIITLLQVHADLEAQEK